jgi:ferric-dicitrate binding protein FerR (iron transport regulator)
VEHFDKIQILLIRHFRQELTPMESADLEDWLRESEKNRQFLKDLHNTPELMADVRTYGEEKNIDLRDAWKKMQTRGWEARHSTRIVKMKWRYMAAAAAVLLIVLISAYLMRQSTKPATVPVIVKDAKQDAKPKSQHAYLTLDNGETIVLDSLQNGLVATQGNTQVVKYSDGVLRYANGKNNNQKLIYNKVTVPKGSDVVYLQLSDQTKVWLNAESSIRYPVAFSDDERKVEITGEAYFEVTKSQKSKFIVSKGNMNVVVLGTRFNVNTYDNESNIKVTLLEGSVKVQLEKAEKTIKPGQQAVLNKTNIDVLNDVDLGAVMAWKEGRFVFNNTNIQLIMRQMERWYDLDKTQFESEGVKQMAFNGAISRYNNASKVLELLEEAGALHFKIQGKKVILYQ